MFHRVLIIPLIILYNSLVQWHLFYKKLLESFHISSTFKFAFISRLFITLRWYVHNQKFSSRVFEFKSIHSYSWIHMILFSRHLLVQTHCNSFRPTFFNFYSKCEEIQSKLHSIVPTLLHWVLAKSVINRDKSFSD